MYPAPLRGDVEFRLDKGEYVTIALDLPWAEAQQIADNIFDALLDELGTRFYVGVVPS